MDPREPAAREAKAAWAGEIEHAIDNVKRTKFDRWMRKEWHKADARSHWSEGRKIGWASWRRRRSRGGARNNTHQPSLAPVRRATGRETRERL